MLPTPSPSDALFDKALISDAPQAWAAHELEDEALASGPSEEDLMRRVSIAEAQAKTFIQQNNKASWERSYKAFRNEHFLGSKYLAPEYRGRSKVFRPKTRSAVRKDLATVASALFSTASAVRVKPEDDSNPQQIASAMMLEALVNYRLDRTSRKNSIPWFRVAMGARQDALITGICVSKQYWKYREEPTGEFEDVESIDETGARIFDRVPKTRLIVDKPCIDLIAPEHLLIDPAADWTDPVNSAAYLIIRHPMHVDDIRAMAEANPQMWKAAFTDEELKAASVTAFEADAVRRAREGGHDRYQDATRSVDEFALVWVFEVFMKVDGVDLTFWTLGTKRLLTAAIPVADAYPAFGGDRPIVIGVGAFEAHRLFPMSPVESWQQLQQEVNDIVNLRLDNVKQNMSPITKVKRGKRVDLTQVQKRGPNAILMLDNFEDVDWDRPPDVTASAYAEMNHLNVDFDDLSGTFNAGSVATNRQLNETVGGLRLLSGAANAVSEFDVRTWVETWCEPVIYQLVKLEQYYETDIKLLAMAGQKAQLFERFGISAITDELLQQQVTARVDVGIGAADPMQKLSKFQAAAQIAMPLLQNHPQFASGELQLDPYAVLDEVFGNAGYRDGGKRFIKENPKPPGPSLQELLAIENAKADLENKKADANLKEATAEARLQQGRLRALEIMEGARTHRDQHQRAVAEMNLKAADAMLGRVHDASMSAAERQLSKSSGKDDLARQSPSRQANDLNGGAEGAVTPRPRARRRRVEFIRGPDNRIQGGYIFDEPDEA